MHIHRNPSDSFFKITIIVSQVFQQIDVIIHPCSLLTQAVFSHHHLHKMLETNLKNM